MPVEQANYVNQLNPAHPAGGESISEGDDHLRVIKNALTKSFKNIGSEVTATSAELNAVGKTATDLAALTTVVESLGGDVEGIDQAAHGNVASCYFNPDFPNGGIVYEHNVRSVDVVDTYQTKITFRDQLDGWNGGNNAHFAFNLTAVSSSGNPVVLTVTGPLASSVSFLAWEVVGDKFELIPGKGVGFSLMVNDMDRGQ
jgi:hypothetical protein